MVVVIQTRVIFLEWLVRARKEYVPIITPPPPPP